MKCRKSIFRLTIICLLSFCASQIEAQQSRVDSVIALLNNSVVNSKQDTSNFGEAIELLYQTSLTAETIDQLENASLQFDDYKDLGWPFYIQLGILNDYVNNDAEKAIHYGKLQIEELENYNTPETSEAKAAFLSNMRFPYRNSDKLEDGIVYFTERVSRYKALNDSVPLASSYFVLAGFYKTSGLTDLAIYNMKKSISYIDSVKSNGIWANNIGVLGSYYQTNNNFTDAQKFLTIANRENLKFGRNISFVAGSMAKLMLQANQPDSATHYLAIAKKDVSTEIPASYVAYLQTEAQYLIEIGNLEAADKNLDECWQLIRSENIPVAPGAGTIAPDYYRAIVRIKQNRLEDAIALLINDVERLNNRREDILRDYKLLAELYSKTGQHELAAETYAKYIAVKAEMQREQDKLRSVSFEAEQQMNEKERSIEKLESQNEISSLSRNFSIGIAFLLLVLSGSIFYRFQSKKKANEKLNRTLANLKSTQSQLIQAEKMASLGELTAGIAHEIQNPLNFVNNFSELNSELIDELKAELAGGNVTEVEAIANDLSENEAKITHHGKRADAIVKGMLAHSRSGKGEKSPTDLNSLAEEYLKLSYHGLRAKDNSFNADFKTDFDPNLPKVNVVPQDIGRVLLNLINNAFQALGTGRGGVGTKHASFLPHQPTVTVKTERSTNDEIRITIADNGPGIPPDIKEKIFQPFFTTKPTGEGTGLGLSLSYDIVKAHGGELTVESTTGVGTVFSISLPLASK